MIRGSLYPSWRYHADGRSELCLTPEEDVEMGADWSDEDIRLIGDRAPINAVPVVADPEPDPDEQKKRGRPKK